MKHFPIQRIGLFWAMLFFLFCCTEDNEPLWNAKEEREIQAFLKRTACPVGHQAFLRIL